MNDCCSSCVCPASVCYCRRRATGAPVSRLFGSPPMVPSRRHRMKKMYSSAKEYIFGIPMEEFYRHIRIRLDISDSLAKFFRLEYEEDLKYLLTPKNRPSLPTTTQPNHKKVRI